MSYFGKGEFQRAIQSFELELGNAKPHPRCRYYLALALQSTGRLQDAISQLNQTIANNSNDADALYELARMHKNASLQAIERLKTIDPDSFQLHALMGALLVRVFKYALSVTVRTSTKDEALTARCKRLCCDQRAVAVWGRFASSLQGSVRSARSVIT